MSMQIPSRYNKMVVYKRPSSPTPEEYVPFTVKVLNAGTNVSILKYNTPPGATLYYSVDDGDWTEYTFGDAIYTEDHVAFSGTTETFSQNDGNTYRLSVDNDYVVSGHLDSLINKVNTIPNYAFWCFFNQSTTLKDASDLIMPSGVFGNHVFERLFYKCGNLTGGPALPAVELSGQTYRNMFAECSSLVKVGAIGAKVIRWASMQFMFYNCTSLTALPEFSPTFIEYAGCKQMCHYCSSIRELNLPWSQLSSVNSQSCLSAFSRCTSLVSVSGSIGTTDMTFNNGNQNFLGYFQGCTSLVDASNLTFNALNINGETVFGRCFRDDSSLTGAPNLPATGMNYQCYNTMFRQCSSLKDAPYLPAQTPAHQCYNHMFNGCTSLSSVHVELTSWGENFQYGSTDSWLNNVAANGTFTKPAALSEEYGSSRIPTNWTVVSPVDPDLIWHMDFSNGLVQPNTEVTGEVGINATNEYVIQTDQQMGTYLQCTKSGNTSFDDSVHWPDSQTYLNNIFTDGHEPFTVSFWMRAPQWNSYGQQIPICWKFDDDSAGLVCYRDGNNADKIDARLAYQHNFFTDTDAQNQDWVHWVFVREADGTRKWYRNGVLDATDSVSEYESDYLVTATRDITIGWCGAWSCNAVFDVTKYRIYKRALTSSEVAELYTNKE